VTISVHPGQPGGSHGQPQPPPPIHRRRGPVRISQRLGPVRLPVLTADSNRADADDADSTATAQYKRDEAGKGPTHGARGGLRPSADSAVASVSSVQSAVDSLENSAVNPWSSVQSAVDSFETHTSLAPLGTRRSGMASTIAPSASANPVTSTSERNGPICFGGKLITPRTCLPSRSSFR